MFSSENRRNFNQMPTEDFFAKLKDSLADAKNNKMTVISHADLTKNEQNSFLRLIIGYSLGIPIIGIRNMPVSCGRLKN